MSPVTSRRWSATWPRRWERSRAPPPRPRRQSADDDAAGYPAAAESREEPRPQDFAVTSPSDRRLLMPQVATEWGWDAETFLAQTCHKAGLARDAWTKGARLWRFEAEVFGESEV